MSKSFGARINGFWINFPNGYSLSTQFGACNYGDNHDSMDFTKRMDSNEVEVGIMKNGKLIETKFSEGDIVIGYVNQEKWLEIFDWVRSQPKEHNEIKGGGK